MTPKPSFATHQAQLADLLNRAYSGAGISVREIARRAGTSHATLLAYRKGRKMPSFATLMTVLNACGYAADVVINPRIRQVNGLSRDQELQQVLELAEAFPNQWEHNKQALGYPIFGASKTTPLES